MNARPLNLSVSSAGAVNASTAFTEARFEVVGDRPSAFGGSGNFSIQVDLLFASSAQPSLRSTVSSVARGGWPAVAPTGAQPQQQQLQGAHTRSHASLCVRRSCRAGWSWYVPPRAPTVCVLMHDHLYAITDQSLVVAGAAGAVGTICLMAVVSKLVAKYRRRAAERRVREGLRAQLHGASALQVGIASVAFWLSHLVADVIVVAQGDGARGRQGAQCH